MPVQQPGLPSLQETLQAIAAMHSVQPVANGVPIDVPEGHFSMSNVAHWNDSLTPVGGGQVNPAPYSRNQLGPGGQAALPNGYAPMGYKLVGHRGHNGKWINASVAPDPEARRVMGEIVRVRDKYGWSFAKIADYVEEWLAAQQSRSASKPWEKRKWAVLRCARAYKEELAIRKGMNGNGDQATLP